MLLLRLIHLEPLIPVADWLGRLEALEKGAVGTPGASISAGAIAAPAEPAVPAAGRAAGGAAAGDLEATWKGFLEYVRKKEGGPLLAKLSRCRPNEMKENCLWVNGCRLASPAGPRQEAKLKELVTGFFGPDASLCFEAPTPEKAAQPPASPPSGPDLSTIKQQALEILRRSLGRPAG